MDVDRKARSVLSLATMTERTGAARWPLCYSVPSSSRPGERYTVVLHRDGTADCECVCGQFKRHGCVHVASAILVYWRERRQRAAAQPALRREGHAWCRRRALSRAA